MAPYGTHSDVAARLPRGAPGSGVFDSTSRPTDAVVTEWIAQASALIDGNIQRAGYDPTTVSPNGALILELAVTDYVAGLVERYWGGEDAETDDDAGDRKREFIRLLEGLRDQPAGVALELGLTIPEGATAGTMLASFHTDSADRDDLSIVPDRTFKVGGKF